jgi:hypothetical protein
MDAMRCGAWRMQGRPDCYKAWVRSQDVGPGGSRHLGQSREHGAVRRPLIRQRFVENPRPGNNVDIVIIPLHITTVDALAGWPTCEKVVYENRSPGSYQELVRLQKRQTCTVQLMMRGRLRWRTGHSSSWNQVETGQALIYDAGIHGDLEYAGDHTGGHLEFIYVNLIGEAMRSAVLGIVDPDGEVGRRLRRVAVGGVGTVSSGDGQDAAQQHHEGSDGHRHHPGWMSWE